MTTTHLSHLPSRIESAPFRAAERADPYREGMFATGSSDGWVSASQHRRAPAAQMRWSGIPAGYVTGQAEALKEMRTNRHRPSILAALGAVSSWRTVTREQLACIAGSRVLGNTYPAALSAPFSAGLLAHGYVSAGMNRLAPATDRMSMWTVGDQIDAYAQYRKSLTFAEHVAITGGQDWNSEHRFDRHNVLTTKLALRVAEFCDVATVLGEKQVALALMLSHAVLEQLPEDAIRCRGAVAVALGVKPWQVQVARRSGGGFVLDLPTSFLPSRHTDRLTEVAQNVVGRPGWWVDIDPKKLTAKIIPAEPPTFAPVIPYQAPVVVAGDDHWSGFRPEKLKTLTNATARRGAAA